MTVSDIVQRLDAKRNGDGFKARCPSHDDKTPSLSIKEGQDGKVLLRCFAGCSIEDITAAMNIKTKDLFSEPMTPGRFTTEAMQVFNATPVTDLSGGVTDKHGLVASKVRGEKADFRAEAGDTDNSSDRSNVRAVSEPAQFSPLTPAGIKKLAAWRGYSEEFVKALSDKGAIGTVKVKDGNAVAFPVTNGWHYRKKDGSWRFTEGAKPDLLVLGEIEEGAGVHAGESQWDMLALADVSGERDNIVATRGAANAKLLADRLKNHTGTIYLWRQNDEAGEKWEQDIRRLMPEAQLKSAATPKEFSDLSDWHKSGDITDDVMFAWTCQSKTLPVPALDEPHPRVGISERIGEARESAPQKATVSDANTVAETRGGQYNSVPLAAEPLAVAIGEVVATGTVGVSGAAEQGSLSASLAKTLDDIVTFLKRYIFFAEDGQAELCALWVCHTYVFEKFSNTPYLHIASPEQNCGKSTVLKCLRELVRKPEKLSNTSESALFRVIDMEKPTLLCDEVDNIFADEKANKALIGILNDGYEEGGTVIRCEDMGKSIGRFNVYCPKAFTGIGKIPSTLQSRCIDIRLKRQPADHKAEPCRRSRIKAQAGAIAKGIEAWAATAEFREVEFPEELSDGRVQDMSEPLLAIADLAGGEWPTKARVTLSRITREGKEQSYGTRLLADCRKVFGYADEILEESLLGELVKITTSPWAKWWSKDVKYSSVAALSKLADMLSPYGITPKDDSYAREEFKDAWLTYLPEGELGL